MDEQPRAWPRLRPRQTWRGSGPDPTAQEAAHPPAERPALNARRETGLAGEQRAAAYLAKLGYGIIERNWRNPLGELDIVAMDSKVLVIIEVRTLASVTFGLPEDSVGAHKQRQLERLAGAYVQHARHEGDWRIDVIAIDRNGLRHIKNAVSLW